MFIQEAYTRRLNATSITTGAHGYVQNAYAALAAESEDEDDDVHTDHADGSLNNAKSIDGKYGGRDKCIGHRGNEPARRESTSDATAVCGIYGNVQHNVSAYIASSPTTYAATHHPKTWHISACRIWIWRK